ncbi:hypothetical protein [uncultured Lactococcus sp.]|uniref:hypothetical protein n=1 Tax=uncultured Lactococcus sp. TaxID=167973 RepID=UPI002055999B|nr:hypothetical protein [uncultured Lactococcus sp.]DAK67086.1 MAG TPA: receptor binding protein [Caudoviricetes sp.]
MTEIQKIYRGMKNGAETIDDNFKKINSKVAQVIAGDLPKGKMMAKTGFTVNDNSWYRVKNGMLQISCTGLSITSSVPAGAWKDVCSLTGADSINSTGDAITIIMNANNTSYSGARARVVNGVLRILPETTITPTQYMNDFIMLPVD